MKTIHDIEYIPGTKILVRVDFNVPINNGVVTDDFRIRAALPTLEYLSKKGAIVIAISHLESNDGTNSSLAPVVQHFEKLGHHVTFVKEYKNLNAMIEARVEGSPHGAGHIFLLENLRFYEGEKANDASFAKELASLADLYVNDAFPVSHREHASIVGIPQFLPSYAGLQFEKEISHLSQAFNPSHPFVFVLGGAKFDTKLPLIERFSNVADSIFLGGALGNDALLAKGIAVGASKVSNGKTDISHIVNKSNIIVPIDATIQDHSSKEITSIGATDAIMDAGPKTLALIQGYIQSAKFILWNGPLGPYENGYVEGTESVAKMIADRTQADPSVVSMVGGGDTLAAIANLGIEDKFTFVSSGGGAMLDFLAKGTLAGIEALEKSE